MIVFLPFTADQRKVLCLGILLLIYPEKINITTTKAAIPKARP